ncbi:hypothetical protein D3C76_1319900 [compost metagenome]
MALIKPMVPMEIRSSMSSPVLSNFLRLWTRYDVKNIPNTIVPNFPGTQTSVQLSHSYVKFLFVFSQFHLCYILGQFVLQLSNILRKIHHLYKRFFLSYSLVKNSKVQFVFTQVWMHYLIYISIINLLNDQHSVIYVR